MKYLIPFFILTACVSTNNNMNFYKIQPNLQPNQIVEDILIVSDNKYVICGGTLDNGRIDKGSSTPFVCIIDKKGSVIEIFEDFDCNWISNISLHNNTIIVIGEKYRKNSQPIDFERVIYRYEKSENIWVNVISEDFNFYRDPLFIDSNSCMIRKKTGSLNNITFAIFNERGFVIEKAIKLLNSKDVFTEKLFFNNKIWGLKNSFNDTNFVNQTKNIPDCIISIDINKWEIKNEIIISELETGFSNSLENKSIWISEIKVFNDTLYLLGSNQADRTGYVWTLNPQNESFSLKFDFKLNENETPVNFHYFDNSIHILLSDISSHIPVKSIISKSLLDTNWERIKLPYHTRKNLTFNKNIFAGMIDKKTLFIGHW